jgi:hypothetical protein
MSSVHSFPEQGICLDALLPQDPADLYGVRENRADRLPGIVEDRLRLSNQEAHFKVNRQKDQRLPQQSDGGENDENRLPSIM